MRVLITAIFCCFTSVAWAQNMPSTKANAVVNSTLSFFEHAGKGDVEMTFAMFEPSLATFLPPEKLAEHPVMGKNVFKEALRFRLDQLFWYPDQIPVGLKNAAVVEYSGQNDIGELACGFLVFYEMDDHAFELARIEIFHSTNDLVARFGPDVMGQVKAFAGCAKIDELAGL